jgi:hypothetical protein
MAPAELGRNRRDRVRISGPDVTPRVQRPPLIDAPPITPNRTGGAEKSASASDRTSAPPIAPIRSRNGQPAPPTEARSHREKIVPPALEAAPGLTEARGSGERESSKKSFEDSHKIDDGDTAEEGRDMERDSFGEADDSHGHGEADDPADWGSDHDGVVAEEDTDPDRGDIDDNQPPVIHIEHPPHAEAPRSGSGDETTFPSSDGSNEEQSSTDDNPHNAVEPCDGQDSPLLKAALELEKDTPAGRDLTGKLEAFDQLEGAERETAEQEIWQAAADIVGRVLTEQNLLLAYRAGLIRWWEDPVREVSTEEEVRERHPLVAWVWDTMREQATHGLEEAVQVAVIEILFPGAHLILPPTNLVAALFTAAGLENLAHGVH